MMDTVYAGLENGNIISWHAATNTTREFLNDANTEPRLALSPDEQLLFSGSKDGKINEWNAQTGALVRTVTNTKEDVWALACTESHLFIGLSSGKIVAVARAKDEASYQLLGHSSRITALIFNRSKSILYSSDAGGIINAWDIKNRSVKPLFINKDHQGRSLSRRLRDCK